MDHIADDNPDAAQALKDEIELKVSRLSAHPKLYRVGRVKGTREVIVRRNYVVDYAEAAGEVTVLRVLHAAREWPRIEAPGSP